MKRTLLVMMGGAIALLIGAAANAVTTSGKVVATDALTSAITIETDDGRRFPFTMNDATKIEHKGVNVALGDLREDSRVTVTTEQTPADPLTAMLATRVQVEEMAIAAPVSTRICRRHGTSRIAGADGDRPVPHRASAIGRLRPAAAAAERLPKTATPLPLIAVLGAGLLACGLVLGMWSAPQLVAFADAQRRHEGQRADPRRDQEAFDCDLHGWIPGGLSDLVPTNRLAEHASWPLCSSRSRPSRARPRVAVRWRVRGGRPALRARDRKAR